MNKTRRVMYWLAFAVFVPNPLFSLPPTENAHGVIVKFRNAAKTTYKMRDQLHAQLGTQLTYRPKKSPYDFVLPKDTEQQRDFAQLSKLCETYQSASVVAECEINYDLFARSANETDPVAVAPAKPPSCELTPTHGTTTLKDGSLSPYWAQELIGADLVAFPRNAVRMGVGVRIAVVDQGFGSHAGKIPLMQALVPNRNPMQNHGALSLGLLTGPTPFSLQAPLVLTHLFDVQSTVDFLRVLESLEEGKKPPTVLQISVDLGAGSKLVREALKRLSEKSLLVAAAGNDWPAQADRNEQEFPGILVGSISPEGYPSLFSSDAASLTISAPSDRYLQSSTDGKTAELFGGTSGATALVASTVAAAKSLVPDLTLKEIKEILKQTAFPVPASLGNRPGYASLNAVQFLAVVDRIRSWNLSGKIRDRSIETPGGKLYQFEKDAESELGRATTALSNKTASCEVRKLGYNQARRAFFLAPQGPARELLAGLMKEQGYTANARFAENLDTPTLKKNLAEDVISSDSHVRAGAARVAGALGAEGLEFIAKFAESNGRAPAAEGSGPALSTAAALKAIANQMDDAGRKALAEHLRASGKSEMEKLADQLVN